MRAKICFKKDGGGGWADYDLFLKTTEFMRAKIYHMTL
jgi:hypothetical protein